MFLKKVIRLIYQFFLSTTVATLIAAFHTQRPGNYSIFLLGQTFLATIFVMKTNQVLRPFSTTTEPYVSKED